MGCNFSGSTKTTDATTTKKGAGLVSDREEEGNVEGTEDRTRYFSVKENNDPGVIWK